MKRTRKPAVANQFYPGDAAVLRATIVELLRPHVGPPDNAPAPRALIVPHAGYVYSGAVAAAAYARLRPYASTIRRVVLLGPAHRIWLRGLGLSTADEFSTPLGSVPIDHAGNARLALLPMVARNDEAHALEHSLEVQLPFLQVVLSEFELLPIVVGDAEADEVRVVLTDSWADPGTLFVVSTDLSHYHGYEHARRVDHATSAAILASDDHLIGPQEACGCRPLNGLLRMARSTSHRIELLALCNSGDTAGPRDRVVGYGAYVVY